MRLTNSHSEDPEESSASDNASLNSLDSNEYAPGAQPVHMHPYGYAESLPQPYQPDNHAGTIPFGPVPAGTASDSFVPAGLYPPSGYFGYPQPFSPHMTENGNLYGHHDNYAPNPYVGAYPMPTPLTIPYPLPPGVGQPVQAPEGASSREEAEKAKKDDAIARLEQMILEDRAERRAREAILEERAKKATLEAEIARTKQAVEQAAVPSQEELHRRSRRDSSASASSHKFEAIDSDPAYGTGEPDEEDLRPMASPVPSTTLREAGSASDKTKHVDLNDVGANTSAAGFGSEDGGGGSATSSKRKDEKEKEEKEDWDRDRRPWYDKCPK
ncbi:hypothetical protein N7470_008564 [Penicillium chermesinum]|nr:hypothetical protein N7470_008564 [Penicillium chermesinum]